MSYEEELGAGRYDQYRFVSRVPGGPRGYDVLSEGVSGVSCFSTPAPPHVLGMF